MMIWLLFIWKESLSQGGKKEEEGTGHLESNKARNHLRNVANITLVESFKC